MNAKWEVEQKYHVDDSAELRRRLEGMDFSLQTTEYHQDTYFRHPCRDFRTSDEAFRLRIVNQTACLTYKGPKLTNPLAGEVKTRVETELSIDVGEESGWRDMLDRLGFIPLPTVCKQRCIYTSPEHAGLVLALDSVEQLGQFAEIESIVLEASLLDEARARIRQVGVQLGLVRIQPQSYLAQLLAKLDMP